MSKTLCWALCGWVQSVPSLNAVTCLINVSTELVARVGGPKVWCGGAQCCPPILLCGELAFGRLFGSEMKSSVGASVTKQTTLPSAPANDLRFCGS